MTESVRLERCDSCRRTTVWVPHPAGWRCSSCSLCAEEWQQTLEASVQGEGSK